MAQSGSINLTATSGIIIKEALELLGVLSEGESYTTDQFVSANTTLNMLVKTLQADGLNLWSISRRYLFLEKGISEYLLSNNTPVVNNDTSAIGRLVPAYRETLTNGALSAGASVLVVDDAANIVNGDYIGYYTSAGVLEWNRVWGAPSGNSVYLVYAIANNIVDNSIVYYYPSPSGLFNVSERPMKIDSAYIKVYNGSDIPIDQVSREEYYRLPTKDTSGSVNQIYYDPQLTTGNLFVWPRTSDERDVLCLLVQRTLQDFDTGSNEADYPQEWFLPLTYTLAYLLTPKYGTPERLRLELNRISKEYLEMARGFDRETNTSAYFVPDRHD